MIPFRVVSTQLRDYVDRRTVQRFREQQTVEAELPHVLRCRRQLSRAVGIAEEIDERANLMVPGVGRQAQPRRVEREWKNLGKANADARWLVGGIGDRRGTDCGPSTVHLAADNVLRGGHECAEVSFGEPRRGRCLTQTFFLQHQRERSSLGYRVGDPLIRVPISQTGDPGETMILVVRKIIGPVERLPSRWAFVFDAGVAVGLGRQRKAVVAQKHLTAPVDRHRQQRADADARGSRIVLNAAWVGSPGVELREIGMTPHVRGRVARTNHDADAVESLRELVEIM